MLTGPLPQVVKVQDPTGRIFDQGVEYDWVPNYCNACLQVGHDCSRISDKLVPVKTHQKELSKQKQAPKAVMKETKDQHRNVVQKWVPRPEVAGKPAGEPIDEFLPLQRIEE
ncbi:hypothetical protein RDI58_018360 [Solanum bulbocastanum]|uniref:Uncharacterized protein n=1 Tax=Solanum bulbocastanum TaxID=147425 RepID=A0AAN8TCZ2_SOLBU